MQFGTLLSSLDIPTLHSTSWPGLWKECIFRPNQMSPFRGKSLQWISSYRNQLHTPSTQRAMGGSLPPLQLDWDWPRLRQRLVWLPRAQPHWGCWLYHKLMFSYVEEASHFFFCAVLNTALKPSSPYLTLFCLVCPVNRRLFQAK